MPIVKDKPMKLNPLVSIVIAVYNEEKDLPAAIEAFLKQSYKKTEIIIVENNNSTDKTYVIAKDYAEKYKNIKAYSIKGKQRGPGNAWNFGIKNSKGEIIVIGVGDILCEEDYIKKGIIPILKGETVGVMHKEEWCANPENIWARAFFLKRSAIQHGNAWKMFHIIRKDYVLKRLFDPKLGYGDDSTIFRKEGTEFLVVDIKTRHINPPNLKDTWIHGVWSGASNEKPWTIIFGLPAFPIFALYKTIKHLKTDFYPPFVLFLPFYYSIRYFSFFTGAIKRVLGKF